MVDLQKTQASYTKMLTSIMQEPIVMYFQVFIEIVVKVLPSHFGQHTLIILRSCSVLGQPLSKELS